MWDRLSSRSSWGAPRLIDRLESRSHTLSPPHTLAPRAANVRLGGKQHPPAGGPPLRIKCRFQRDCRRFDPRRPSRARHSRARIRAAPVRKRTVVTRVRMLKGFLRSGAGSPCPQCQAESPSAIRRHHRSPGRKPGRTNPGTYGMNSPGNARHDLAERNRIKSQDVESVQPLRNA
jgi:hypothetical protein